MFATPATSFRSIENPNVPLSAGNIVKFLGLDQESYTGRVVNPTSALEGTVAVYACVKVLAESIGALPLPLYQRTSERDRKRVSDSGNRWQNRIARLLHQLPNPEMTSQELWETLTGHVCLWGNAYANVVRDEGGKPIELWPLRPDRVEIIRVAGERVYKVTLPSGEPRRLGADEVMHVRALSYDGLVGISPLATVGRNAVALEQAAAEHSGRFFSNGSLPGGVLTRDRALSPDEVQQLRTQWEQMQGGLSNAHRVAILHGGLTWQQVGIPPEQAQLIETRKFQINEIARLYRIPPHMIGELDRATFSNIEQQSIEFVVYTLTPWLERFEQSINRDLGNPGVATLMDNDLYAEFNVEGLLRGDTASRYSAYGMAIRDGWMSREEVRSRENLPHAVGTDELLPPTGTMQGASLGEQVNAAGILVRSGFEPEDALRAVGLDPIKHLGLLPVTLQHPGNDTPPPPPPGEGERQLTPLRARLLDPALTLNGNGDH